MKFISPEAISQEQLSRPYTPTPFVPGKSICSVCGQPITQEQIPSNPRDANYVRKWKVHAECRDQITNMLDRLTDPGRKY